MGSESNSSERAHSAEVMHHLFIILGFLSLISFSVVLTPILFKKLRHFLFLKILVMISLCDTVTAVAYIMNIGRPIGIDDLSNNTLCQVQGVLYSFSINASISWTLALSVQLYTISKYLKPYFSELQCHCVFWSIPIFIEIIPFFSDTSYGMDDYYPEASVNSCYIRAGHPNIDRDATYFAANAAYKIINIVILVALYLATKRTINSKNNSQAFTEVTRIMLMYPLAMIFLWLPTMTYSFLMYTLDRQANTNNSILYAFCFISSLYGIAVTAIYFYGSRQARHYWYTLFTEFTTDARPLTLEELNVIKNEDDGSKSSLMCMSDSDMYYREHSSDTYNSPLLSGDSI